MDRMWALLLGRTGAAWGEDRPRSLPVVVGSWYMLAALGTWVVLVTARATPLWWLVGAIALVAATVAGSRGIARLYRWIGELTGPSAAWRAGIRDPGPAGGSTARYRSGAAGR